jgi:hypothetical protein
MNLPRPPWFGFRTIETSVTMKMTKPMRLAIAAVMGSM